MSSWVEEFFISKGELFLLVMNRAWERGLEEAKIIKKVLEKHGVAKGRILEICCGNGRISINLAKIGYEAYGIDISERYIRDAKERAKQSGVEEKTSFIVGDVRELSKFFSENHFDAVLNIWTSIGYYDADTDQKIFREAYKVTKNNGIFIITNCASRESMLKSFCKNLFEDFKDLVVLHYNDYDIIESRLKARWVYYKREDNKDLRYLGETTLDLRLYSIHEVVKMLENAGWKVIEVLDNLREQREAKYNSPINIIAKKVL